MAKSLDAQNAVKGLPDAAGPAPVHLWNPPFCGRIDMRIDRDGNWHYAGSPIMRDALVRLFARVLKREGSSYFLVTPAEKVEIEVEDVPFIISDLRQQDGTVILTTLQGEDVPLTRPRMTSGIPYVMVRSGLEARIDRKTFYRLVDLAQVEGDIFGIHSAGSLVPLCDAEDLS
ncbi:DUF1285 domain-containing protein [Falsirhodobacter deserti]|uniref:DUF1285 domain-containing protein n=1 Tax=Falsirhodobacter deserti TaxID=1365611 RepID=UPI000FE3F515|nr:DUF1285 domain-containing protein [Falsirhodobacter deserti]